jgi:hypothetical protein
MSIRTLRAELWRTAGSVAHQSQNPLAMILRRASPAARHNSAHSVPICEMGSNFPVRPCNAWAPENRKKGKTC